ncbi:MAG: hypothetical protein KDC38_15345, partial [Planctomycetes bacterium]|nr:hypothetical protein [Planctomycetota bacterium]
GSLEPEEWPLVAGVLLKFADLEDKGTDEGRGRAFDWTNAALTTLDMMNEDKIEVPFEDEFREWANELVRGVADSFQSVES